MKYKMAEVLFLATGEKIKYLDDGHDVKPGDIVFVSGSRNGIHAEVKEIYEYEDINPEFYQRITDVIDFDIPLTLRPHGQFFEAAHPNDELWEKVQKWFISSDYSQPEDAHIERMITDMSNSDVSARVMERALEYINLLRVMAVYVSEGKGTGIIVGREIYIVKFNINSYDSIEIECNCPYDKYCKHEAAIVHLLDNVILKDKDIMNESVMVIDRESVCHLMTKVDCTVRMGNGNSE